MPTPACRSRRHGKSAAGAAVMSTGHRLSLALFACTLLWTPTTTYVDGRTVIGPVRYRVHLEPQSGKDKSARVIADVDTPTVEVTDCPAGVYWVTAYSAAS